jgi:hypothetical protein
MRRQFQRGVDGALVLGVIWVMGVRVLLFDNVLGRVVIRGFGGGRKYTLGLDITVLVRHS